MSDLTLDAYLDAWRRDSTQAAPETGRERVRAAMLATLDERHARRIRLSVPSLPFRARRGVPLLAGSSLLAGGVAAVAVLGWNAPAGSPLYGVRAVRQSIQLSLPGANPAALHLQYAEQSLDDARHGIDVTASLQDARAELLAAESEISAGHAPALWNEWQGDERLLAAEESEYGSGPAPGGGLPVTAPSDSPEPESPSQRHQGGETPESSEGPEASPSGESDDSHQSPEPSDDGGDSSSPRPSGTPGPDD